MISIFIILIAHRGAMSIWLK